MGLRSHANVGPLPVLLTFGFLLLFGMTSCADSTSPSAASNQDPTDPDSTLNIQGTVRVSSGLAVVQSAIVRVMLTTDVGTSAWVTDTTAADGKYAVQVQVPGGCAGRDSVYGDANVKALGYWPHSLATAPKFACRADAQTLDLLVDPSPPIARTPQPVAGNLPATLVDAGRQFACATTASGAYCWGVGGISSALGQDPNAGDLTQPRQVTGGEGLMGVSAADKTACALDQSGAAWCWGADDWGNLGIPDSALDDPTLAFAGHATAVETDLRFTQVAAGTYTVCGLTAAGTVYCWGAGATLGAGDSLANIHPTPVRVPSDRTFVQVSEGYESTCALDDGGNAWCWGRNNLGQLGNPQAPAGYYVTAAQQVVGGHLFVSIAVGGDHACGLTAAGEAWCWGSNGSGQLGDGNGGPQGQTSSATPVAVAGGHAFTALFGGLSGTCGLTADGSAYCWGDDESGQLGLGDLSKDDACGTSYCVREPMPVSGGLKFSTLGAGADLTCGITTAGKLYCWGLKAALGTG
jgi:alpha-tubulin suppressor-like RCC1 family protein